MFALIAHEIGHICHKTKGGCFGKQKNISEKALFQLYSEGVAMLFEQLPVSYTHLRAHET